MRSARAGGNDLGVARAGETGETHQVAVVDECGRLLGGHDLPAETRVGDAIGHRESFLEKTGCCDSGPLPPILSVAMHSFIGAMDALPRASTPANGDVTCSITAITREAHHRESALKRATTNGPS